MDKKPPLSERIRNTARLRHLSLRTEITYLGWIKQYYYFYNKKDPALLNAEQI